MICSPREIQYASFLKYWPRGESKKARNAKKVVYGLKNCAPAMMKQVVERLGQELDGCPFRHFFGPDVTLVPTPMSSVTKDGSLWRADLLCGRLVAEGLGGDVLSCLRRTTAVPSSKSSKGADRPGVPTHMKTMAVERDNIPPSRITVVDDVVTRGATLFVSKTLLEQAFSDCEVNVFAFVRTSSVADDEDDEGIVAPVLGTIDYRGGRNGNWIVRSH